MPKEQHSFYPRGSKVFVIINFRVAEAIVDSVFFWKNEPEPKYDVSPTDGSIGPFINGFLESQVFETSAEAEEALEQYMERARWDLEHYKGKKS